jgi:hypothetical protein
MLAATCSPWTARLWPYLACANRASVCPGHSVTCPDYARTRLNSEHRLPAREGPVERRSACMKEWGRVK